MPFGLGFFAAAGAGGAGATFEHIATAFGSGTSGTITFSNIPQTYKHLQLRIIARHEDGSSDQVEYNYLRFNGVTTNTYTIHGLSSYGAEGYNQASSGGQMFVGYSNSPASGANQHAAALCDISDYAVTTKNKTIMSLTGGGNDSGSRMSLFSGAYYSTDAITSLSIISPNTTTRPFRTTSRFSLYGIKG